MINRLIKTFEFSEATRNELVFTEPSKIRMNPTRAKTLPSAIELKQNLGVYPTDPWLAVRSQIYNPVGIQKWLLLDEVADKPTGTSILYRMSSMVGNVQEEYYHDGINWRIAIDSNFAIATLTVIDWSVLTGTNYSISGNVRGEGNQWTASISNNATAQSIKDDINTFANVFATIVGNVVTIKARASGFVGNSIPLLTSDPINLSLSSATLLGGLDAEYNTIAQINAKIVDLLEFIINTRGGDKRIFVKANLKTTDSLKTPLLYAIKLLGQFEVEWMEDIIYDTIRKDMHSKIRYPFDLELSIQDTTSTIDLADENYSPDNEGYNVVEIESVYNMTDDPHRLNNLFLSYTPGALNTDGETNLPGIITLNSSVAAGKVVWMKIKVVPEFAVNTDQDFYELKKFPTLVLEKVEALSIGRSTAKYTGEVGRDYIRDLINGTAVEMLPPAIQDLRIGFSVMTSSQVDLQRLTIAVQEYFNENTVVRTKALDEKVTQILIDELVESQNPDLNDANISSGVFVLKSVPFFLKKSLDRSLVEVVNMQINPT